MSTDDDGEKEVVAEKMATKMSPTCLIWQGGARHGHGRGAVPHGAALRAGDRHRVPLAPRSPHLPQTEGRRRPHQPAGAPRSLTASIRQLVASVVWVCTHGFLRFALRCEPPIVEAPCAEFPSRRSSQPSSALRGKLALLLLVLLMVFGTVFACLPIFPATSCLVIAGGHGCGGNSTAA